MNPRLERLPKWKGIPVPFFVTWRTDGVPDFKVTSEGNRMRCFAERLCWICGEQLGWWVVFIGGPVATAHRKFVDGPCHEECATDALDLCPFLAGRMDYAQHFDLTKHTADVGFITDKRSHEPPERVALYKTRGFGMYVFEANGKAGWFFKAGKPVSITWRERR